METVTYFFRVIYWWHIHILRGLFGPEPKAGQTWEFTGEPWADDDKWKVFVEDVDRSNVHYKYEGGRGIVRISTKFQFRTCYRPSK